MSLIPLIGLLPTNGLLSVSLVRNGQLLAALCTARSQDATAILCGHALAETMLVTARSQDATAILCGHALAETMLVHAATIVRLKCSFHCFILNLFTIIHL